MMTSSDFGPMGTPRLGLRPGWPGACRGRLGPCRTLRGTGPCPGDPLAGTKSLAQIRPTADGESRLLRYVSLFEVLLRDFVLEEDRASGSLFRMIEAHFSLGPRPVPSASGLEYALNVRNAVVHPNSGLRQTAPAGEYEIRFACEVLDLAVREAGRVLEPGPGEAGPRRGRRQRAAFLNPV